LSSSDFEDQTDLGNAKARFARLVLPHLAAAYGLARSLTRNPSDAEDVVQEACLRAYRALDNTPVANARAWVLTIVHNTAYTWLRKNRTPSIVAVDDLEAVEQIQSVSLDAASSTPEAEIIAKTDGARLEAMMRELPPQFREVLMLREVEGYSYREIAEVTGVPIGTVMSRLKRARDQLIAAIGRDQS
jgi:RNA polymerase sigma-70 factor (ECF subfamily)